MTARRVSLIGHIHCHAWVVILALLLHSARCLAFREGEFIPTARKAQYNKLRSHWHELISHHAPRFGHDRIVALPLPKPEPDLGTGPEDDYKLQLSFNGDRLVTPWLKIIGRNAPEVPLLDVELRRSGDELLGVTAQIVAVPKFYRDKHLKLVAEFTNATHWPKHLLIRYHFLTRNDVDLDRGLYVLLPIGLLFIALLVANAARGSQSKLAAFLAEITGEEGGGGSAGWKAAVPKAD